MRNLLVIMLFLTVLITEPTLSYASNNGYTERIGEYYTNTLLGKDIPFWKFVNNKIFGTGVVGFLNDGKKMLVKVKTIKLEDIFTSKPYLIQPDIVNISILKYKSLSPSTNYIISDIIYLELIGPMKNGGLFNGIKFYKYNIVSLNGIDVYTPSGAKHFTDYKSFFNFMEREKDIEKVKVSLTVHKTENDTEVEEVKPYIAYYKTGDPEPGGTIITPFEKIYTFTYNPYSGYFVGSGEGLAWRDAPKEGDPLNMEKYTIYWFGPLLSSQLLWIKIPSKYYYYPDFYVLPSYYINFLKDWSLVQLPNDTGNCETCMYKVPEDIWYRVTHVPKPKVSAYIPFTPYTIAYYNKTIYIFSVPRETGVYRVASKYIEIDINKTGKYALEKSYETPVFEKHSINLDIGNPSGLWFISTNTLVTLESDRVTLDIYKYNGDIMSDPSVLATIHKISSFRLPEEVENVAYNNTELYLILSNGDVYKVNNTSVSKVGRITSGSIDVALEGENLIVLYPSKLVLYKKKDLSKVLEKEINKAFTWVSASRDAIVLTSNTSSEIEVYAWLSTDNIISKDEKVSYSLSISNGGYPSINETTTSSEKTGNNNEQTTTTQTSTSWITGDTTTSQVTRNTQPISHEVTKGNKGGMSGSVILVVAVVVIVTLALTVKYI